MWVVKSREINIERVRGNVLQTTRSGFFFKNLNSTCVEVCLCFSHPSQSMISGPSNENGSEASGSDFIL